MEKLLQDWAKKLKQELGNNLASVILYGSAARGEYIRARSDLNLMLVFKKLDLEHISKVSQLMSRKVRKQLPQLVFWTEEELEHAWDVFPLEFEDIKENHQCLVGKDLFNKRKIDKKRLRYEIEFELRSKLVSMRDTWLTSNRDKYELEMFLIKAGNSFDYLIRKAAMVLGKKLAMPWDVFEKIKKLKKKEIRLRRGELQDLFRQLHETVESVIRKIDAA
ncbi:MAG: nucleotidyltransferase domain-containing protein [Desulfobacterales bacterium]|nr:nucleotidyltransferase domain-containing protein [Desulfobacterales bacterium]